MAVKTLVKRDPKPAKAARAVTYVPPTTRTSTISSYYQPKPPTAETKMKICGRIEWKPTSGMGLWLNTTKRIFTIRHGYGSEGVDVVTFAEGATAGAARATMDVMGELMHDAYLAGYLAGADAGFKEGVKNGWNDGWEDCMAAHDEEIKAFDRALEKADEISVKEDGR